MRRVAGRAIRITSCIVFFGCGLISLLTGVPYAMLRGVDLPVQSEWVIFVVALALARIIREVITNDSQWCKVGYESQ